MTLSAVPWMADESVATLNLLMRVDEEPAFLGLRELVAPSETSEAMIIL
jgi:hypothetical protein